MRKVVIEGSNGKEHTYSNVTEVVIGAQWVTIQSTKDKKGGLCHGQDCSREIKSYFPVSGVVCVDVEEDV